MASLQALLEDASPKWMMDAECADHPDLPWTGTMNAVGEVPPTVADQQAMAAVCAQCPVLQTCAGFALNTRGIGGFYAGLWLPWPLQAGAPRARRTLRKAFRF